MALSTDVCECDATCLSLSQPLSAAAAASDVKQPVTTHLMHK